MSDPSKFSYSLFGVFRNYELVRTRQCSDEEYIQRLTVVDVDRTPYRPSHPVSDNDPRWRRGYYSTCHGTSEAPASSEEGGDGWREHLRRLVTDPTSKQCLFVNAVVRQNICYGFAAATTTTMIEEVGGTPYNISTGKSDEKPRKSGPANWRRSSVRPKDIVRFVVNNCKTPVILVGCDFDHLLTTAGRSFFDAFCWLEKLSAEALGGTDGRELCNACFPVDRRRGDFITEDGLFLYCQDHAKTLMCHGAELLLYRPTLVSICVNDTRVWLSAVDKSVSGEAHLTYFELPKTKLKPNALVYDDGALLLRKAREWSMSWHGSEGMPSVLKAMQYLCARLLANTRLCPPSENMGPPTSLWKVHRT